MHSLLRSLLASSTTLALAGVGVSAWAAADDCPAPHGVARADAPPSAVQALCPLREGHARVKIADRWGLVAADGRVVVAPRFDELHDFINDRAGARQGALWGFIDGKGQWVVEPKFSAVTAFTSKRAAVTVDGKVGYIDEAGQWVVPPSFAEGLPFRAGVALVREADGTQMLIDEAGGVVKRFPRDLKVSPPNDFGLYEAEQGGQVGLLRTDGEWTIKPTAEPLPGRQGRPYVVLGQGDQRRAIDLRGRVSTPERPIGLMEDWPQWWWPRVESAGTPQQVTVYSSFDFKDRVRVPGRVLPGQTFMDGVLVFEPAQPVPGKRLGLFNHHGKLLGLYGYDEILPMKEGFSVVGQKQPAKPGTKAGPGVAPVWRYGHLDSDGRLSVPVRFEAAGDFSEERAVVRTQGQLGLIDIQGKLLMHSGWTCGERQPVLLDAKKRISWPESARGKKVCAAG